MPLEAPAMNTARLRRLRIVLVLPICRAESVAIRIAGGGAPAAAAFLR
jgi:hypothetical protein